MVQPGEPTARGVRSDGAPGAPRAGGGPPRTEAVPRDAADAGSGSPGTGPPGPAPPDAGNVAGEGRRTHVRAGDPAGDEIVRRLRSVEGHVRGVERMVREDAYCIDVVNQILAVQRALKKVSGLVLDRHLHTCVTTALRGESADARERVIEEILDVFDATGKA